MIVYRTFGFKKPPPTTGIFFIGIFAFPAGLSASNSRVNAHLGAKLASVVAED